MRRTIRERRNRQKQKSRKKKATQVHNSSSDSGKNESADDDSHFEPTDGAGNDDDDDDDEEGEINLFTSAYCHDSDIDNNPLALSEERKRGAGGTAEELTRSAQEGAANSLRTSNSEEHCTPPSPPSRSDTRTIVNGMPSLEAPIAQKNVVWRIVLFVKNRLFRQIEFVTKINSFNEAFQKVLA